MLKRMQVAVLVGLVVILPGLAQARTDVLTPAEARAAKAAFKAIDRDNWKRARRLTARITDPLVVKIIRWLDFTRQNTDASFRDIADFIADNPDWPYQKTLRRRAEESMGVKTPTDEVLSWFRTREPVSVDGQVRYGAALLAAGEKEKARAVLRKSWIYGNFGKRQERGFYKRYRALLTSEDHVRRLDRLLWEGRYWPVRRMLRKVNPRQRALAEARLLLRKRLGNVDRAIARVPADLKDHPGLVYERLRWRRRKGRDDSARELLVDLPRDVVHPEKWWTERAILVRRALQKGFISDAYVIAREHGLSHGADFAEAEWLAGWIALRFLEEGKAALDHFAAMFDAVRYPVSRARGAYWAGRAAQAMGEPELADSWYRTAAGHPTAYYGQLAAARLRPGRGLELPPEPEPDASEVDAFEGHELARVVRILSQLDRRDELRPFVLGLGNAKDAPGWRAMTAVLARAHGRPDLAIAVAKKAGRAGRTLVQAAYPLLKAPALAGGSGKSAIEAPLVLAMVRQESAFNPRATSGAGARGLMQLLPHTAYTVARRLKVRYSRSRLTSDSRYNLRLGQAYIAGLVKKYDGSYVLALAAYNAGPSQTNRWIRNNGDPRDGSVDVIDWIEMIPFDETRNYIQRVLENLQVYRRRLADKEVVLMLESDLRR
ncbi:MAG: lytic transglycosylase domain-containing protein [Proteobacteria bacterium]|nr:lytic transglycosylase domain-containing protein [Pseudomonadota bacterium]